MLNTAATFKGINLEEGNSPSINYNAYFLSLGEDTLRFDSCSIKVAGDLL